MTAQIKYEIDVIDFQIACRRFHVRATVTREKQMPVVDEFVLRMLAITDRMSVSRLRAWFGFSEHEMQVVLVDLGRRALIELDREEVTLAAGGRELFRAVADGGIPRLVEVEPIVGDVWFDLVSRNMVPRSRSRPVDYLVKLREHASARTLPDSFARESFEANFRDYARRIRRFPDADSVHLYSISDIEGGRYAYQTLRAGVLFEPGKMTIRPAYPELDDAPTNFSKLTVAANDAWQVLNAPDSTSSSMAEYERMTGDDRLSAVLENPISDDAWSGALQGQSTPGFQSIFGASYSETNVDFLSEAIARGTKSDKSIGLIWLRPGGTIWGRTLRVPEALQALKDALRNAGAILEHESVLMPRSTHRSVRTSHKKLFAAGALLPQGHVPSNLEVLLLPGIAALVNVHVQIGTQSVPIGGIVTDPKRLSRINDRLQSTGDRWEMLWGTVPTTFS